MIRHRNDDDDASSASSRKRIMAFDKGGVAPWLDVNHDVLFLIIKKLGVVDFLAFSGVCKSWRSFAVSNKKMFMASLPPLSMEISTDDSDEEDSYCHFEDFEGRRFKTILPHFGGRSCFGLTCGYLILFGKETHDFWLVNPITKHELHFPDYPLYAGVEARDIRAILVFSPSISRWVFVVLNRGRLCHLFNTKLLVCVAGERRWNHVSSTPRIIDLHYFKGKLYTLHNDCSLHELRLYPKLKCKWMLLETNIFLKLDLSYRKFVCLGESLYMKSRNSYVKKVLELDFGEMKCVSPEKTIGEHAFFISRFNGSIAIKHVPWGDRFLEEDTSRKHTSFNESMWYFPDQSLDVNLLHDS